MLGPTANLIFKNRKMYIKLYTIWHCNFVEKKINLNESAIRLVFGFAFLGKLHFYNRRKLHFHAAIFHMINNFYIFYQTLNFILKNTFSKHNF